MKQNVGPWQKKITAGYRRVKKINGNKYSVSKKRH